MKWWAALLMLLPAVGLFLLTFAVPMLMVGRLAFLDSDYLIERWVGLKNFAELFKDKKFLKTFANVGLYLIPLVPYTVLLCYGTASMLTRFSPKAQSLGRFVAYRPSLTSGLIVALLWKWLLAREGLINQYLVAWGGQSVGWLTQPWTARMSMLLVSMSTGPGGLVILSSAALSTIPKELHDAAMIDGASESQYRRMIVRPMMTPMIMLIVLLCIVGTMQIWETVYVLTGDGGPKGSTSTPVYDLFRTAFIYNRPGYAAAKGIVLLFVIGALVWAKQKVERWAGHAE
jgi:multiple sugar transport system permease protein